MHLPPPPPPPPHLFSLTSRQQGLLGGAEAFFHYSYQKLIFTEISDKQTSQAEAEFEKSLNVSQ